MAKVITLSGLSPRTGKIIFGGLIAAAAGGLAYYLYRDIKKKEGNVSGVLRGLGDFNQSVTDAYSQRRVEQMKELELAKTLQGCFDCGP